LTHEVAEEEAVGEAEGGTLLDERLCAQTNFLISVFAKACTNIPRAHNACGARMEMWSWGWRDAVCRKVTDRLQESPS
jgi:hypothetical protein